MTDPSLNERIDLAWVAIFEYRQNGPDRGLPEEDYRTDRDVMAALISDLRHYADWRGIDFDEAATAGGRKYNERRALEWHPYAIGAEVRRQPDGHLPSRGVIVSIYPDDGGAQTYHVRFPGDSAATPCREPDLRPADPFPATTINQGTVTSLPAAERIIVETTARIRSCNLRGAVPDGKDIADISVMATALAETCDLTVRQIMDHLEPEIGAFSGAISQPWRPVTAVPPAGLAASSFPYPPQTAIEPRMSGLGDDSSAGPAAAQQPRPTPASLGGNAARPTQGNAGRPSRRTQ
jgi:hypothetical protein